MPILLDAAVSGATGALMIGAAGMVDGLLGLPVALMRSAGIILIPYAAFVAYVGTRVSLSLPAVWAVIVTNALWAAASVVLLLSGWVAPTALGYAFVIAQAAVVAVFGELQYTGLRRPAASADDLRPARMTGNTVRRIGDHPQPIQVASTTFPRCGGLRDHPDAPED